MSIDDMLRQYILTALWSSSDAHAEDENDDTPLERNYSAHDLAPETLATMREDCERFLSANEADIGDRTEDAGHDFWLTRNHDGAGFWDGGWPEEEGKRLTDAAHAFGEVYLYVGDDGKIYQD